MRLNSYINEGRSQTITEEKVKSLIDTQYNKATEGTLIYRGNRSLRGDYYFLDPTKSYERESPFATANFYNLLFSNLPSWRKYPKRNKSVICTTSNANAFRRGCDVAYIVLPINDADIGVCPADDIWFSFKHSGIANLNILNYDLIDLFKDNTTEDNVDVNWHSFLRACKELEDNGRLKEMGYGFDTIDIDKYVESKMSFIEYLNELLNPDKNKLKMVKPGAKLKPNVEVWTDSPCLLINRFSTIGIELFNTMRDNK